MLINIHPVNIAVFLVPLHPYVLFRVLRMWGLYGAVFEEGSDIYAAYTVNICSHSLSLFPTYSSRDTDSPALPHLQSDLDACSGRFVYHDMYRSAWVPGHTEDGTRAQRRAFYRRIATCSLEEGRPDGVD
jgi:hypothetical protein